MKRLSLALVMAVCVVALFVGDASARQKEEKRRVLKESTWLYQTPGKVLRQKLPSGAAVVVLEEKGDWVNVKYYMKYHVEKNAVKDGKITATTHLRSISKPEKELASKLNKGNSVWVVSSKGAYYVIETPEMYDKGWIKASALGGEAAGGGVGEESSEKVIPATPRTSDETPKTTYTEPKRPEKEEAEIILELAEKRFSRTSAIDPGALDELNACKILYESALAKTTKDYVRTTCNNKIDLIDAQIKAIEAKKAANDKIKTYKEASELIKQKEQLEKEIAELKRAQADAAKEKVIEYDATGWVEPVGMILNRPGTHRLKKGGEIWWLRSENPKLNLNKYLHKQVGILGKKFKTTFSGEEVRVLVVEEIHVVDKVGPDSNK